MIYSLKSYPAYKDSGVEWLGDVPAHWGVAMVKQNYTIQLGKMLQNGPNAPDDVEIPYLKAQHVQWFHVRTTDAPKMWASQTDIGQFGVAPGDLLVCEGGEGGRSGILKQGRHGYIIQNALHRVRPQRKGRNDFLQYVMSSVAAIGWFDALNDKATIAHFTREKFGSLRMPIPPLPEQAAIVRFLDHADRRIRRYIRAKQKLIVLLEEQKQALIHQAVTGQIDVRTGQPYPAYKPSGVEWLGDIPEHWRASRIGRLFVQRSEVGYSELPILEVSLISGVRVRDFDNSSRKQIMSDRSMYKRAVKGDIAYNMMRMWQGAVGVAPVDGLVSPAYVVAKPLAGAEPRYFNHLFHTSAYMIEVDKYSRGIVKDRNRLYWEDFKQMPTPRPPSDEQVLIAGATDRMAAFTSAAIRDIRRQIHLLHEYRTRLIADVVTGKLDVREAAAALPDDAGLSGNDRAAVEDEVEIRTEALEMTDWHTCPAVERKPGKVSGAWVFAGTRIPLSALYENLASGATIDEFVEWFPGVDEQQVRAVLEHEAKALRTAAAP